jgi:hexosaminidase
LAAFLALVSVPALAQPLSVDVIPRPQRVQAGDGGAVRLRDGAPIVVGAHDASAVRTARWLSALALRSRGLRLVPTSVARQAGPEIILERRAGSAESEAYQIDIGRGRVTVRASSDAGLLYGAVTLWQLITADEGRGPVRLTSLRLKDQPRFAWRGLLLDSARHMQSAAFIERMIDWMALHKLNILQWHLTDDEGWRLPIEGYPRLTTIGAWRVPASVGPPPMDPRTGRPRQYGGFYSRAEIRSIVAHARVRNVTIVPEVEMPGHALSALLSYPQLSAGPVPPRAMQSDWGVIPAAYGVDERVFGFLHNVLGQVIDLFPGRFIAIGGDEIPLQIWKASPEVQARMKALGIADELGMQNYFIRRVGTILAARGRRMIGWEEILKGGPLPPDAAITSWSGSQSAVTAAKAGHDVVLGIAPTLYFDNRQSEIATEPPGRGWVVSLHDVYALDPGAPPIPPPPPATPGAAPAAPVILSDADRAHILGVQGNLWTEHIRTEDRLAKMAFPRAAAVAETGWTAQADRNWPGFLARLPTEMARFSRLGLAEDDSAFAIDLKAAPDGMRAARVTLANQTGFGQVRYNLGGQPPTAASHLYTEPLRVTLPARLQAATFAGPRRISPVLVKMLDEVSVRTRVSQQLTLCPGNLPLILEGQTVEGGARPAFLVQIMNPCWIWPDADLSGIVAVKLDVVAAPFNLQLGADLDKVVHRPATSRGGEIQVRLDNCDTGELLATAPVPEGRTGLKATLTLPAQKGVHALCFAYAGARVDPIWGLRQVELVPRTLGARDHG